ncbi:histidine kinase [bacterium]|nr:histidine kinase [bacterium]
MKKERLTNLAWIFGIFLILAAFFASETYVWYWVKGKPPAFWTYFRFNMARWYPWAFLTPLIIRTVRRYPFNKNFFPLSFIAHLGLNALSASVVAIVYAVTKHGWCVLGAECVKYFIPAFVNLLHYNVLAYWLIAVITHLANKLRFYRENELRLTQLQASVSKAQYRFLSRQIRPHFLFNTLHALSALIHIDIKQADFLIGRLSDFLRRALDDSGVMVALEREFEIVRIFIDIEKIRFGSDFQASVYVDNDCLDYSIPNMMLQPMMEILMGREGIPMRITCSAECQEDSVSIIITREGEKMPNVGMLEPRLLEIRQRLDSVYPKVYSLNIIDEDPDSISLHLSIPKWEC